MIVESGILGFGIRNPSQGIIRDPANDWNPDPSSTDKNPESTTWNPEFTTWNGVSKTILVYLTWVTLVSHTA